MAIENEELMEKFVRAGMIMRHIDGEEPHCHKHGPHGPHGHHGHGHGHGPCCHGHHHEGMPEPPEPPIDEAEAAAEEKCGCEHPRKHGHGHGPIPFPGHEHGPGHGPKGKCHRGQARALSAIALKEGINQKELAFVLGIRPQTLGVMLQKLERHGMIERKKSETDGRAIEVTLTDRGRERAAALAEQRKLAAADMFSVLSDEEKEQLGTILDKLSAELDKKRPHHCCKKHAEKKDEQD